MIPIARPELGELEQDAASRAIASGWVSQGPRCLEFEAAVATRLDLSHARAVNSCTNAILLTLIALGVKAGDEVIVPAFTCVAALNPIELLGATPVPVDIDAETFSITARGLEEAVSVRTRGVLMAHLFGLAAHVEPVADVCQRRGLWLIEDIALGFGATIGQRPVGSFGDAAVVSFHPRKLITTGEGGMVATNSADIADAVGMLRNYGASRPAWERHHKRLFDLPAYTVAGLNCKMTDIQAAVGIEQVRRMDSFIEARTCIAQRYDDAFQRLDWIEPVAPRDGSIPSWQSYLLRVASSRNGVRDRLLAHLDAHGVAAVQSAQGMHTINYYSQKYGWAGDHFPTADIADRSTLCLPIFPSLSPQEQDVVIEAVCSFRP
jgi:dTDP-4-amino-4,6-dideoxygalactose transaminase